MFSLTREVVKNCIRSKHRMQRCFPLENQYPQATNSLCALQKLAAREMYCCE